MYFWEFQKSAPRSWKSDFKQLLASTRCPPFFFSSPAVRRWRKEKKKGTKKRAKLEKENKNIGKLTRCRLMFGGAEKLRTADNIWWVLRNHKIKEKCQKKNEWRKRYISFYGPSTLLRDLTRAADTLHSTVLRRTMKKNPSSRSVNVCWLTEDLYYDGQFAGWMRHEKHRKQCELNPIGTGVVAGESCQSGIVDILKSAFCAKWRTGFNGTGLISVAALQGWLQHGVWERVTQ